MLSDLLLKLNHKWVGGAGILGFIGFVAANQEARQAAVDAFTKPSLPSTFTAIGILASAAALYYAKPHPV